MRAQLKAVLKTKLQVEQSSRIHRVTDAVVIDGCVMLLSVHPQVTPLKTTQSTTSRGSSHQKFEMT